MTNRLGIIPSRVRYAEYLTPAAKLVYAEVSALANERGECDKRPADVGASLGLSRLEVARAYDNLVAQGYLKKGMRREKDKSRRFYLRIPKRGE